MAAASSVLDGGGAPVVEGDEGDTYGVRGVEAQVWGWTAATGASRSGVRRRMERSFAAAFSGEVWVQGLRHEMARIKTTR